MREALVNRIIVPLVLLMGGVMRADEPKPVMRSIIGSVRKAMLIYKGETAEPSNYILWCQEPADDYLLILLKDKRVVKVEPRIMSIGAWVNDPSLGVESDHDVPMKMTLVADESNIATLMESALRTPAPEKLPWMIETGEVTKITLFNIQTGQSLVLPGNLVGRWNQAPWKPVVQWLHGLPKAHQKYLGSWGAIPPAALAKCLMWAVINNRKSTVEELLSDGADVSKAEDLLGENLVETARERGNEKIAALLERWKATFPSTK